jgi:hypothetical protein
MRKQESYTSDSDIKPTLYQAVLLQRDISEFLYEVFLKTAMSIPKKYVKVQGPFVQKLFRWKPCYIIIVTCMGVCVTCRRVLD